VPLTEDEIITALRPVHDPELHRSIVDLGMVRRVDVEPPKVTRTRAGMGSNSTW